MFELKRWQIALLKDIKEYLDICYYNKNQKEMDSPFENTGNSYETKTLKIKAYDWVNDNEWNLKFDDIVICWYKYLGRGTYVNKELTNDEWIFLYGRIINEIRNDFGKFAPDRN